MIKHPLLLVQLLLVSTALVVTTQNSEPSTSYPLQTAIVIAAFTVFLVSIFNLAVTVFKKRLHR